jgi:HK97 gp10 family phage protein
MADKITIETEGFAEFDAQLKALADGYRADLVAKQTLAKAGRAAMQRVYDDVVYRAPYDALHNTSGIHLRDTVRIDSRIPNQGDKMSEYVEETDATITVVSVKKSAVSLSQEFGNARTTAQPFLRIALESNINEVVSVLKSQLGQIIPDYWKSLRRRGIK